VKRTDKIMSLTPRNVAIYITLFIVVARSFELIPSGGLERFTAETSSNAFRVLGFSSRWGVKEGEAYLTLYGSVRDVVVIIVRECTAINVFAVFVGLVVPLYSELWLRKAISLAMAGVLLFILNISRVVLTVALTAFDVPPFSWVFTNPTVETYHYPLSFLYGLFGVAILVLIISRWTLPELEYTLKGIFKVVRGLSRA